MTTVGAYNPAVASLIKLWKDAENHHAIPSEATIAQEVKALHQSPFTLDPAAGTAIRTTDRPLNIDSLGKGFIVSKALAAARTKVPAARGILLNIGGDIATAGYAMLDRKVKWTLSIADPAHPEENAAPLVRLMMTDLSVATSGGYARGYDIDGTHYSHILDPRTGKPGRHSMRLATRVSAQSPPPPSSPPTALPPTPSPPLSAFSPPKKASPS